MIKYCVRIFSTSLIFAFVQGSILCAYVIAACLGILFVPLSILIQIVSAIEERRMRWPKILLYFEGFGGFYARETKTSRERFFSAVSEAKNLNTNRKQSGGRNTKPPKLGEYLLYFFLSKQDRINLLGDLEEEFKEVQEKFGRWPAKLLYYKQVTCSIGPLIWRKLAKWGAIAWVEEWLRRHI